MKKKALLSSILTIALCLSLIAGSTFALFTSESKVNVAVTSGKVDVKATIENLELYSPTGISGNGNIVDATNAADTTVFKNGGTASLVGNKLTLTNITPGDKVTFDVKITNNSNVTVQYRSIVEKIIDTGLWAGLKVSINGTEYNGETKKSDWTVLNVGSEVITVPVVIELPATAGNAYQEKSCELVYIVEAVQGNAQMSDDEWDGSSVEALEQDESGVYHITNAAQFMALMNSFNDGVVGAWRGEYAESQIVLDCNIDLGGAIIERGIPSFFYGKFDGQGHMVSNFTLKRVQGTNDQNSQAGYYTSLFGTLNGTGYVKNLTVENATIVGNKSVSAIVGTIWGGTVENCHVVNSTMIGIDQVGAVVGYNGSGTVKDCSATDCTIFYTRTEGDLNEDLSGATLGVIGDNDGTATGCTASNTAPEFKAINCVITNAAEFQAYITGLNNYPQLDAAHRYDSANVVLTSDIDLGGAVINVSGEGYLFSGSFDGLGHTVSNYTIKRTDGEYYTGLFSVYMGEGGEIKNLTVKNGTVISNGNQVAAIVPSAYDNATVDNCHAIDCTVVGVKKVGAVTGFAQTGGTVSNCSAQGCSVYASNNEVVDANLFGYDNGGTFSNNEDKGGNIVEYGVTSTFVTSAADLTAAVAQNTATVDIRLLNDITMPANWTPIDIGFYGDYANVTNLTIDGNGHTISGLKSALIEKVSSGRCEVTIKNLTVKDAAISNSSYTNGMGNGILVGYVENGSVTLDNCHVVDSEISESSVAAAALIGYISNGTEIKITSCTVKSTEVNGDSAAGFVGYAQQANITVSGCEVSESTFTGETTDKQGAYFGTVNVGTVVNISSTTADTTALVGRILSTGSVNYN